LTAVCHWWRTSHTGVCALEGIGGAGKTALVDRFLRTVPGVMSPDPLIPQDGSLPSPEGLFVFSFYDAPNPETFFWELAAWLLEDGSDGAQVSIQQLDEQRRLGARPPYLSIYSRLARVDFALIVLDGLEKVQDDGIRGGAFGAISDAQLKDFFYRAADGYMRNVGILITTRFPLEDLYQLLPDAITRKRLSHYRTISVEQLTPEACVDLLKRIGVRGADVDLARIAGDCGYHALTVDLFGGYIARFLDGNASDAVASLAPGSLVVPETSTQRGDRYVHVQAARFARVATRYRDALAASQPAALALMQRVCLFRLGATEEVLGRFFTGSANDSVGGPHLAALSPRDLRATLEFLVEIHLLEGTGTDAQGALVYTTHPAVREGFARSIDADTARQTHQAARHGLLATVTHRPGEAYPTEPSALNLLEEVVFHAVEGGQTADAHRIYVDRLGGFAHIGWALADFERGVRICRTLLAESADSGATDLQLSKSERGSLRREWVLYLSGLGQIRQALFQLEHGQLAAGRAIDRADHDPLAEIYLLAGRPRPVLEPRLNVSPGLRAHACVLIGEIQSALRHFREALPLTNWNPSAALHRNRVGIGLPAIQHSLLLLRQGVYDEVERDARFIRRNVATAVHHELHLYKPATDLILAELAVKRGEFDDAERWVRDAQEWALDRGARELLCWSWLVRAKSANARAERGASSAELASEALGAAATGLQIALACGFGIYFIDLVLEQAQAFLHSGADDAARHAIQMALYGLKPVTGVNASSAPANDETTPPAERGIFTTQGSSRSGILAATHPDCSYAWGIAKARQLSAEVALLRAARSLGADRVSTSRVAPSSPAAAHLAMGSRQLTEAIQLQAELLDEGRNRTRTLMRALEEGVLTSYPLAPPVARTGVLDTVSSRSSSHPRVFISYAHADNAHAERSRRWLDRLLQHIRPLIRQSELSIWSDKDIQIGETWHDDIRRSLDEATAAILLISPAYLESEYIYSNELPILLRNAKNRGLVILPVILRPCLFAETRFRYPDPITGPEELTLGSLQAANADARPLSAMTESEQDEVLVAVGRRLLTLRHPG